MTVKEDFLKRRAFTLIELLVVIAIIAILAAILFPVFAQAREKARQTACLSNMKQAGLSVTMYREDFDAHYPRGYGNGGTDVVGWADAIQPYAKNIQFLFCPDVTNKQSTNPATYPTDPAGLGPAYTTYFYNISLAPQTNVNGLTLSVSVIDAAVSHPASSIMIGDGIAYDAGNIQPYLGHKCPAQPRFCQWFLLLRAYYRNLYQHGRCQLRRSGAAPARLYTARGRGQLRFCGRSREMGQADRALRSGHVVRHFRQQPDIQCIEGLAEYATLCRFDATRPDEGDIRAFPFASARFS